MDKQHLPPSLLSRGGSGTPLRMTSFPSDRRPVTTSLIHWAARVLSSSITSSTWCLRRSDGGRGGGREPSLSGLGSRGMGLLTDGVAEEDLDEKRFSLMPSEKRATAPACI